MTRKCRACKTPKWANDPCANAECPRNLQPSITLRSVTLPTTATAKHGYHAVNTVGFIQATSDYDAPIRAPRWRTVAR